MRALPPSRSNARSVPAASLNPYKAAAQKQPASVRTSEDASPSRLDPSSARCDLLAVLLDEGGDGMIEQIEHGLRRPAQFCALRHHRDLSVDQDPMPALQQDYRT